jgi:hypothetical protein
MDINSFEQATRPLGLNRKTSLFASYDEGAVNWAFQLASGQILERSMAMN